METRLTIARNSCKPIALTLSRIVDHKNQVSEDKRLDVINKIYLEISNVIAQSFVKNEGDIIKSIGEWRQINAHKIEYNDNNVFLWNINPIESLDNYLMKDISYYTLVSITKNSDHHASLVYNIKDDVYICATKGEGAIIENEKLRADDSSSQIFRFICNDKHITENLSNIHSYEEHISSSVVDDVFKLISGNIDFLIINNFDLIRYQALILICKEAKLIIDLSKTEGDKWFFLASKARVFNYIVELIR